MTTRRRYRQASFCNACADDRAPASTADDNSYCSSDDAERLREQEEGQGDDHGGDPRRRDGGPPAVAAPPPDGISYRYPHERDERERDPERQDDLGDDERPRRVEPECDDHE